MNITGFTEIIIPGPPEGACKVWDIAQLLDIVPGSRANRRIIIAGVENLTSPWCISPIVSEDFAFRQIRDSYRILP